MFKRQNKIEPTTSTTPFSNHLEIQAWNWLTRILSSFSRGSLSMFVSDILKWQIRMSEDVRGLMKQSFKIYSNLRSAVYKHSSAVYQVCSTICRIYHCLSVTLQLTYSKYEKIEHEPGTYLFRFNWFVFLLINHSHRAEGKKWMWHKNWWFCFINQVYCVPGAVWQMAEEVISNSNYPGQRITLKKFSSHQFVDISI